MLCLMNIWSLIGRSILWSNNPFFSGDSCLKLSNLFLLKTLRKWFMLLLLLNLITVTHFMLGNSQTALSQLQLVQNAATRLLMGVHKRDHITLVLWSLHWLPVRCRVEFKIFTYCLQITKWYCSFIYLWFIDWAPRNQISPVF